MTISWIVSDWTGLSRLQKFRILARNYLLGAEQALNMVEFWMPCCTFTQTEQSVILEIRGLSGSVLDSRPRGGWFVPYQCHCVVSLSMTH